MPQLCPNFDLCLPDQTPNKYVNQNLQNVVVLVNGKEHKFIKAMI